MWSIYAAARERPVAYSVDFNGKLVVVENLSAWVNDDTGMRFFVPETVDRLQRIVWEQRSPTRVIHTPVFDCAA